MTTQNDPTGSGNTDLDGAGNHHEDWGHSDIGADGKPPAFQLEDVLGADTAVPPEAAEELRSELGEDEGPAGG
jgi:hypothetical protein